MATINYKVQKGDTLASLGNPQQIIALNSGVPKLSTGQVIKLPTNGGLSGDKQGQLGTVPKTNGPFVVNRNPLFNPITTQAQGSFVSGSGQVNLAQAPVNRNIPSNVTNSGYLSQNGAFTSTQAQTNVHTQAPVFGQTNTQLVGGSFYSGSGDVNLTGVTTGGNGAGSSGSSAYQRPQGIYTGGNSANDIAWRNYWNYSAANPQSVESTTSTYMPTRNDIWEMKAAQRRREGGRGGGGNNNQYQQPTASTQIGNNIVGGSWRVG